MTFGFARALRVTGSTMVAVTVAAGATSVASAQSPDFFKSHKLTLGVPSNAGGGYDTYTRLLSRHMAKHIPGNPTIVVQNVPAGGGMALANQVYNTVPKDGSYLGMIRGTVIQEQVYKNPQALFDGRKFVWIGNMNSDYDACITWAASGVKTIDDLYKREVIVGASGAGAQSYSFPIVYNELLGTKFKVISGYPGTPERLVAMERGELHGACGITTSTFRAVLAQPYKDGKVVLVAQAGSSKDPAYPDVPNMLDQAKSPEARQALEFLFVPLGLGRPFAGPPEMPVDRTALLRKAFDDSMKDPDLLADAKKVQVDIEPMNAEQSAKMVQQLFETPAAVVAKLQAALAK
ncbi:MAG: Bug family tripartite tricarboxylate transporter substrate binding protein [Gemmatimonas sp.]